MKQHLMIRDENIRVQKSFAYLPTTLMGEKALPKETVWWTEYLKVTRRSPLTGEVEVLGNFKTEEEILVLNPTLWNKKQFPNQECFWFLKSGTYTLKIPQD